jgi:multidrug efflux pump subunit AcrB
VKVSFWASRHARSILFLLIALICGGVLGTLHLPVSLFPHINFPRIRVNFDSGDRPAEQMMIQVTKPVEEALRAVPGVLSIHSTTNRGGTEISMFFNWGQDMSTAALQVQGQIDRLLGSLPGDTSYQLRRMDPTVFPVIAYSITSDTHRLTELHDLAQYQISPVLSTVQGVTTIGVAGGAIQEYRVTLDPARLAAHSLALNDVTTALSAANVISAVGHIQDRYKLYLVVSDTRFKSLDQIGQTILRSGRGGVTTLSDIATIESAEAPQYTWSVADGKPCVLIQVFQQPDGNTPRIAADVDAALQAEKKRLPADVTIKCWYDQSDLIDASKNGVRDAVVIGVALAALVLLLFLRNWRMTLIATVSVPAVLSITALVLYALGQSFNIMTLGGMAAAVGLIIDDAIVVSEHIIRRLHKPAGPSGQDVQDTVLNAASEFSRPLSGSSLSTIIIHIPPIFLVGVFGAFFAALSLSMASSLIISFVVAWLFIPVLAVRFLKGVKESQGHGKIATTTARLYTAMMRPILRKPWLIALLLLPLLIVGYIAFKSVGTGVLPSVEEGTFNVDYKGPPGASIPEMNRLLARVEKILTDIPEVDTYSRRTGFTSSGDLSETNTGDFYVRLKKHRTRTFDQIKDEFTDKVHQQVPGLDVDPSQLMEDLLDDLSGAPQPVVVNLYSDDENALVDLAPKVFDALDQLKSGKDKTLEMVDNGVVPAGDAVNIQLDRVKASLEGMDPDAVTRSLTTVLAGSVTTQVQQGEKLIDVRVWTPLRIRQTTDDLSALQLRAPDGHLFPLGRIADFQIIPGQPEITRQDLKRVVSVTARNNVDLGSAVSDVQKLLDDMQAKGTIPPQVRCVITGLKDQQDANNRGIIMVVIAAAALVFLLLLFMYERLRVAAAILSLALFAVASVFIGLWITGTQFNISSMMGMVMIVGNVTEVAIFYYSEYSTDTHGPFTDRLIAAGNQRMRAITMTTAAAILALLPLALDIGHTAGMLQPLAIAIITGLIVQLPLVLVVLPALLSGMGVSPMDAGTPANPDGVVA